MSDYPRVEVEWVDSCSHFEAWTTIEEAQSKAQIGPAECFTMGYLFVDQPDFITIVSSVSPDEVGSGMTIPRTVIRRIRHLEERPQGESYARA